MRIQLRTLHIYALMFALTVIAAAQAPSLAKWSPTNGSNLSTTGFTFSHGAYTRLHNGTIIATGGTLLNYSDPYLQSVEIYNPLTGKWSNAEPMHFPRVKHDALLLADGRLLVVGGLRPSASPPYVYAGPPEIYDPATGHWTIINISGADLSRLYSLIPFIPQAFLLPNGKVLIFGGMQRLQTYYLDPDKATVIAGPTFEAGTGFQKGYSSAAVLHNGKVLLLVGRKSLLFDSQTEAWTEISAPQNNGVELWGRIGAILPNGNLFTLFNTPTTGVSPNFINYSGLFDASTLSWGNFVQQGANDTGFSGYAYVLLTQGNTVLTLNGPEAALYNAKTGEAKFTDDPKGPVFAPTLLADGRVLAGERIYGQDFGSTVAPTLVTTSAANYRVEPLAPGSIASVFGTGFGTAGPIFLKFPSPTTDDPSGPYVVLKTTAFARTLNQVNFLIPANIPEGQVEITIENQRGLLSIASQAPGIFTADASGSGVPAGVLVRVKADGTQVYEPVARFDASTGRFLPVTIDLGPEGEQVYLVIFGTGWRRPTVTENTIVYMGGVKAAVQYTGAQGSFDGLDQMNVLIPRALSGKGEVEVLVTIDGKTANPVKVGIK